MTGTQAAALTGAASRGSTGVDPGPGSAVAPLRIGPHEVWPPVVLAPMAGVTNPAFRSLCRRYGGGVFVGEMVSVAALRWGDEKSWEMTRFGPDETPRSLQLYCTDPADIGPVVRRLVGEGRVDHLDLNFGCPAPKVIRKGGGAAIPLRENLLAAIVREAVHHAGDVPVTMKFRTGVDDHLLTFLRAGRIGEREGCAAVALHARTAAQLYDGAADWGAIARLKEEVRTIPVLGNGDVYVADDALAMMAATGCDGVVVGRGCLGRPWLFRDLERAFSGRAALERPRLGEVCEVVRTHAALLVAQMGEERAMRDVRKHVGWYLKGYGHGAAVRRRLGGLERLADLDGLLVGLDPDATEQENAVRSSRAKRSGRQRVPVPPEFLADRDSADPFTLGRRDRSPAPSGG